MNSPAASPARRWFWAAVAMTVFKLWLTGAQPVFAISSAGHDDRLFLQLAEYLVQGKWLGPYDQLTLAKGPFYSIWAAAMFQLGVPLFLSQHLLYAAACAALVRACRPGLRSAAMGFAIYALLLWNPMTYDASSLGRVLRQHVYSPLALLVFAGLAALYYRRNTTLRRLLPWCLLLGLSAGAFWLTREEGVWLVPGALLLAGAVLWGAWRISRAEFLRSTQALGIAAVAALLPVLVVSALNYRYYRWFGTVEFRAAEFQDAYGAMTRVRVGPDLPFVPVTREAREAMYAVSPTFAKLRPHFEGDIGLGWAGASASLTNLPPDQRQVAGGWLAWALRDAVAAAGEAKSAGEAMAFYRTMANEINAACEDGRLPAGPRRSGFRPELRPGQAGLVWHTFVGFADFVVRFSRFSALTPPSVGDDGLLTLFRDLTQDEMSASPDATNLILPNQIVRNERKVGLLHAIGKGWRPVLLVLFFLAQAVALVRVVQLAWQRRWSFPLTLAAAAWGGGAAYLLINALIEVTSYPILAISSFSAAYPMVLLFIGAVGWDAWEGWFRRPASPVMVADDVARTAPPAVPPSPRTITALTWLAGLAALLPFLIWRRQFGELFWFADDFFLVDQIAEMGLWHWIGVVFAENFVPIFKLLWGGALVAFDGSYLAMLWLLWLNHAFNAVLFGRLLTRAGFPWLAVLVAQVVLGLAPANLETLGWSVQWSAVLATTFLLLALLWHEQRPATGAGWNWRVHVPLLLFIAASACSFSRGVLPGPVLALAMLWPLVAWKRQLPLAVLCALPAVAVALVIMSASLGNHRAMAGHWAGALEFGLGYFLFNPGYLLIGSTELGPARMVLLAGAKLALILWALRASSGRVRALLVLLLAYDLGNAVLLGVGRYHTGFIGSTTSRYNYSSLIATLPFLGLLAATLLDRGVTRVALRPLAAGVLLAVLAWHHLRGWPAELATFTGWRGTEMRQLIAAPATFDPSATVPALDFMHVERAKALTRAYNLH